MQSLLAYLMLHKDAPQTRAHLAFLFWPDTTEAQARTNLRNLLFHLRQALPQADSYLNASIQTLQWRSDTPLNLDVADFYSALAQAKQVLQVNYSATAKEALERAVTLYKGDLLPNCYDDWILPEREGLRHAYIGALEQLVRILEEQREYQTAIRNAERILRNNPLQESTYRQLMRLYALNDDRAGALRIYHKCATVLKRELGVEPGVATREAYEQLLGTESQSSPTVPTKTTLSPLIGREREWTQLLQAWRTIAKGGEPHVVMISGEAGIGKTRLAEDLLQWATRQGITCANASCFAAEGELAYAPVTLWLRAHPLAPLTDVWLTELARLLPEILDQRIDLPRPLALTETWQQQRFKEAMSHAILGLRQPLLLMVDDLQWCDRDTLELLHFLLRFDRKARLLVVGTYRPEEMGERHPLVSTLHTLRLEGQVTEVDLQPLDEAATQTLAMSTAGAKISNETAHHLYLETEGNPLFVVETVRAGLPVYDQELNVETVQKLTHDSLLSAVDLPPKIRSVIEARLAQVSPPTRELAELAATIGRGFSFELLAEASGCDEDTMVRELDELWRRRIVREHGTNGYDFTHDKLREVAYNSMSSARRRLLHRHIAQALQTLHVNELDPVSHQVAFQYERADLPEQAIPFYLRAAQVSRRVYANEEAIALLQRGIALVKDYRTDVSGDEHSSVVVAPLWEEMGDILVMKAQHEEALQAYQNAQAQGLHIDPIWQARLHRKAGVVLRDQRHYAEALSVCHRAEMVLGEQPKKNNDRWWDEWLEVQVEKVWAHYWLAQWLEMDALVDKLQPVVKRRGKVASRMRFLMASCLMHLRRERYIVSDEMLADSLEALSYSRELGDVKVINDCLFELGFLHLWRRELSTAEENLQAALQLAQASGIMSLRTLSLTYLTVLHRFRRDLDGVLKYASQAEEAAAAAHMPDYVAVASSNQAWIAWRRRDLHTAKQKGQEALAVWRQSPLVYPFQWQALWPIIAVNLAQGREDQAWDYAKTLLEPAQQLLPDRLNASLEKALQARKSEPVGVARTCFDQAVELAREMGYL
jgi:DNA-binding SARP family transcriptional activator